MEQPSSLVDRTILDVRRAVRSYFEPLSWLGHRLYKFATGAATYRLDKDRPERPKASEKPVPKRQTQQEVQDQFRVSRLERAERIRWLQSQRILSNIPPRLLGNLADRGKEVGFPAGHYIAPQGQRMPENFYLIVVGKVRVMRGGKVLTVLGPGDFFGEMSSPESGPRQADVIAEEATLCLAFKSWDFQDLVQHYPDITLDIMRKIARDFGTRQAD